MDQIKSGTSPSPAGAGTQAGDGGPVQPGSPSSQTGGAPAKAAAVHGAHTSASAPGGAASKAAGHLKGGGSK